MQKGEEFQIFTAGRKILARIENILPEGVIAELVRDEPQESRGLHLTLAQAIPKTDRFEWLIEKAAEIGVAEIVPLITERTIARPTATASRLQRWNSIAWQ